MRVIRYRCDWCGKLHKSEAGIISRGRYYSKLTFHFCDKSCEKAYRENHIKRLKKDATGGGPDDMKKTNTKGNFEGPVANTTKWTCDKCGSHRHFGGMCMDCGKVNKKIV